MVHPQLYPNSVAKFVVADRTRAKVECLEARGESNEEKEGVDVFERCEVGVRSGAESEGFTIGDALRRADLIAASDPEFVLDTSGMPPCKYQFFDNL